jgi:hypothetical protein
MSEKNGWLIERWYGDVLHYWNAGNCGGRNDGTVESMFTPTHEDAVRFARKQDAEVILYRLLRGEGRVVEHIWMDSQ